MFISPSGIFFSSNIRAARLACIVVLLLQHDLLAGQTHGQVLCRQEISPAHRQQLASALRKITGLPNLEFDDDGILRTGGNAIAGSESARQLLDDAVNGRNVIVIEDASNSAEVAFCRVIPGRWKSKAAGKPPAFVVQIDFADFDQLIGEERALAAFNVGWGFLHELDHVVNDTPDATSLGETGACEAHLNKMRRECNLPERADYFFTISPLAADTSFATRLIRLAFEEQGSAVSKRKRYWLTWDANAVGGLEQNQLAAWR